jgi:hypothetical protein
MQRDRPLCHFQDWLWLLLLPWTQHTHTCPQAPDSRLPQRHAFCAFLTEVADQASKAAGNARNSVQLQLTATATTVHTNLLTRSAFCVLRITKASHRLGYGSLPSFSSPVFPARVCSSQQASENALSSMKPGCVTFKHCIERGTLSAVTTWLGCYHWHFGRFTFAFGSPSTLDKHAI